MARGGGGQDVAGADFQVHDRSECEHGEPARCAEGEKSGGDRGRLLEHEARAPHRIGQHEVEPAALLFPGERAGREADREDPEQQREDERVEAQEDVLQVGGRDLQVQHAMAREHLEQWIDLPVEMERRPRLLVAQVVHARQPLQLGRHTVREAHDDLAQRAPAEGRDVLDGDEAARADDAHAVAHLLNLGEHVRRNDDGAAGGDNVADELVERVLDERIEAACRLVEDQQLGLVDERLQQPHLLAVAPGQIADATVEAELQPTRQLLHPRVGHAASQPTEPAHMLPRRQVLVERQLARQVAQTGVSRHGIAPAVRSQHRRAAPRRTQQIEQEADHRGLPCSVGSQEPERRPSRNLEVNVEHSRVVAVVLGQASSLDRGGHSAHR